MAEHYESAGAAVACTDAVIVRRLLAAVGVLAVAENPRLPSRKSRNPRSDGHCSTPVPGPEHRLC